MAFKVLCLGLIACSFVQSAPQRDSEPSAFNLFNFMNKVGEAGFETFEENLNSFRDHVDANLGAGGDIWKAGVQTAQTGVKKVLSGPRIILKLGQKAKDKSDERDIFDKTSEAAAEVIDENAESNKRRADVLVQAGQSAFGAALQTAAHLGEKIGTPGRFAQKLADKLRPSSTTALPSSTSTTAPPSSTSTTAPPSSTSTTAPPSSTSTAAPPSSTSTSEAPAVPPEENELPETDEAPSKDAEELANKFTLPIDETENI